METEPASALKVSGPAVETEIVGVPPAVTVPVTATFLVVAPVLALAMLPLNVPAAAPVKRTVTVLVETVPLTGVNERETAYEVPPLSENS